MSGKSIFAAGSVDGVYPRPVNPHTVEEMMNFYNNCEKGFRVSVVVTNSFDQDGRYVEPCVNGRNDYRSNFLMDSVVNGNFFYFNAFFEYSSTPIVQIEQSDFFVFINKIIEKCKGTLIISFYKLNSFRGKESVTEFLILSA
jgi:hypothetical protein